MFSLRNLKAGEFIDAQGYYDMIIREEIEPKERENIADKFLLLLLNRKYKNKEVVKITQEYIKQLIDIRDSFDYIYNPPQSPSVQSQETNTIGNEYRAEFAMTYGGYVELVYVICTAFGYKPEECLQMKTQDFLFWGNYLLHKKFVENIK
jgi:hypothetical protein